MVFVKGNKLATGRPVGSKNVATLAKEERRAIFEEEATQMWRETIQKLPPTYIADQFMGKAPDTSININVDANSTERTREVGNRLVELFRRGN